MESRHTGGNFKVIIAPIELTGNFSAVSGLNAELECEEYIEGGTFPAGVPTERAEVRQDRSSAGNCNAGTTGAVV